MITALNKIPVFNGGYLNQYYQYEKGLEIMINSVSDDEKPIILNNIIREIPVEQFGIVSYSDITTWEELKERMRGNIMKYCLWCKSGYHSINECPKRFNRGMSYQYISFPANIGTRTVGELKNYIIDCTSNDFVPSTIKLLLNSGIDYMCSVVKISSLHARININEGDKRIIKTPNEGPIFSYGSTSAHVEIKGTTFVVKFDVISDDSPIPEAGVIGRYFMQG